MFLGSLKYRNKIFVLLAIVFMLVSVGLYFVYMTSYRSLLERHDERLLRSAILTSERIESKGTEIGRLIRLFQTNRPLIEYLYITSALGGDTDPLLEMLRPMYLTLNLDTIVLYDMNGKAVASLDTIADKGIEEWSMDDFALISDDINYGFTEKDGMIRLSGIGPLMYHGGKVGFIELGKYIDAEYLEELRITSGNELIFAISGSVVASTIQNAPKTITLGQRILRAGGVTYSLHEKDILRSDGHKLGQVITALSNESLEASLSMLRYNIFGVLIISAIISLGLSVAFTKALVDPLKQMVEFTGRVSKGMFDKELSIDAKDEIAELSVHLNEMQKRLKIHRDTLENYADNLEREVYDRNKELQDVQRQLMQAQKMDSLGTMAGGIAHDFNNILAAILGYSSFLKDQLSAEDPQFQYWDIVEKAALRGAELTSKLLTFTGEKFELGKRKDVDIVNLIKELIRLLSRTFPKGISFEPVLSEERLLVKGYGSSLYQALMNICINARDAMPEGGRITISAARMCPQPGHPKLTRDTEYVMIKIADTGHGMDKETSERIFEPFFTTKGVGKGTGLGLAVVYGIIIEHNGIIEVDSKEDSGTIFTIYLPAMMESVSQADIEPETVFAAMPGKTLLVVDDEEQIRQLCKDALEAAGYNVLLATNGKEALKIFSEKRDIISAIVLDVIMPDMSGYDALRRITEMGTSAGVIIASGFSPQIGARWSDNHAIKGYLQKPFRTKELVQMVNEVVSSEV